MPRHHPKTSQTTADAFRAPLPPDVPRLDDCAADAPRWRAGPAIVIVSLLGVVFLSVATGAIRVSAGFGPAPVECAVDPNSNAAVRR